MSMAKLKLVRSQESTKKPKLMCNHPELEESDDDYIIKTNDIQENDANLKKQMLCRRTQLVKSTGGWRRRVEWDRTRCKTHN